MLLPRSDSIHPNFNQDLQRFLFGREYQIDELPFPEDMIRQHVRKGLIALRRGVEAVDDGLFSLLLGSRRWVCRRCGNSDPGLFGSCACGRCRKSCVYCRRCLNMGVVRSCTELATWVGPEPVRQPVTPGGNGGLCEWTGTLSGEQAAAAAELVRCLNEGHSFLIWAVTGSGKTELMFPAIEYALLRGERVVLTTPRTDVVRELFPRMKASFPSVPVSALYAGSEDRIPDAPLVISTTHQLIRFHRCFDRVFIDEVDAFPFHFDPMLEYAVQKAAKEGAPFAYLTATPPPRLKNAYLRGDLKGAKIARRFHGHPLPVPLFCWAGNWKKSVAQGFLPPAMLKWIKEKMEAGIQIFLFVPSVSLLRELTELLQREALDHVAGVHAEDPDRHVKVTLFREGRIRILVTTTILERGVTVPAVEAAVFGADDPVFDERALVQIAGRVGRSPEYPTGDVVFFHNGRTLEMVRARRHIEQMNEEGGF